MNRNENETESFAGNFAASKKQRLFFEVPLIHRLAFHVDGLALARDNLACSIEVACSHVSGLWMQPNPAAGPDGARQPRPLHSITSSARVRSDGGTAIPSVFAV
jgi:hypothetical protein